jgi:hypothetical protein
MVEQQTKKIRPKFLWAAVSQKALEEVWNNPSDDIWETYL